MLTMSQGAMNVIHTGQEQRTATALATRSVTCAIHEQRVGDTGRANMMTTMTETGEEAVVAATSAIALLHPRLALRARLASFQTGYRISYCSHPRSSLWSGGPPCLAFFCADFFTPFDASLLGFYLLLSRKRHIHITCTESHVLLARYPQQVTDGHVMMTQSTRSLLRCTPLCAAQLHRCNPLAPL